MIHVIRALRFVLTAVGIALFFGVGSATAFEAANNHFSPSANLYVRNRNTTLSQTSATAWTLSKTGVVNPADSTVTWTITATQTGTSRHLVVNGIIDIINAGYGAGTIGNIVVNLQTKSGYRWVTRSSDVADATLGDAATTANVVPAGNTEGRRVFTENSASGPLLFAGASTNTPFSLVPQKTIGRGQTISLRFSAAFNNTLLNLPVGKAARVEIIVTYGNTRNGGWYSKNVDINGNGVIDADEAGVGSAPTRREVKIAPVTPVGTPTLSDTVDDITTTGTVTFSNPVINLGPTGGTVTVTYDGGTDGGTITNCAHLVGPGVNLEACDTQAVDAQGPWQDGDFVTFRQVDWDDSPMLETPTPFSTVYPLGLRVGLLGVPNRYSILLSSGPTTLSYLPTVGTPVALTQSYVDPVVAAGGLFGGVLTGLHLNIDFADAGLINGTLGIPFGDLTLSNIVGLPSLDGVSVRDFAETADRAIAGDATGFSLDDLTLISAQLNSSFWDGPSQFAQDHLRLPEPAFVDGDFITYWQNSWGETPNGSNVGQLLQSNFIAVYPSGTIAFGLTDHSMTFAGPSPVIAYLPASGTAGPLTGFNDNPTSTTSGSFGGDVVALRLNIDFADANVIDGTSSTRFGDLVLHNFPTLPLLENMSVRELLANANSRLGRGPGVYDIATLAPLLDALNFAFQDGVVDAWAQDHLRAPVPPAFADGDFVTYWQSSWGEPATAAGQVLSANFGTVYAPSGILDLGLPGSSMTFTAASHVLEYLPQFDAVGTLTGINDNPSTTTAGTFGGEVLALRLNIDFADAGITAGTSPTRFGDIRLCGFTFVPVPLLNGMTMREILANANSVLGNGPGIYSPGTLFVLLDALNSSFQGGIVTTFARDHLRIGPCPP